MDATTRWETEAMRASARGRQSPPRPSGQRTSPRLTDTRHWVTLREAEVATGIPANTLRKWVRKAGLPSYLEADGDLALRMVDLDAVVARAKELGREISDTRRQIPDTRGDIPDSAAPLEQDAPPGTMIVPIDAWNKMLNQLGNLHEAGQQLATARERAAKAETEVTFLRERLSEMRAERRTDDGHQPSVPEHQEHEPEDPPETTTYWRHLTTGWRDRRKGRT